MPLFFPKGEPRFIGNEPAEDPELTAMKELLPQVAGKELVRLKRDIALHERGQRGEAQVRFELANSHYPLCVIQDLYLEHGGLTAQIDFLVFTPYVAHVIECKHLVGDIEIDERGSFTRALSSGRRREGMYSPVTQNERHLGLMRSILLDEARGLKRVATDRFFASTYRSIVVLADDKGRLICGNAPASIRSQVIRKDQLIRHIKDVDNELRRRHEMPNSLKEVEDWAQRWLARGSVRQVDLTSRYRTVNDSAGEGRPTRPESGTDAVSPKLAGQTKKPAIQDSMPMSNGRCDSLKDRSTSQAPGQQVAIAVAEAHVPSVTVQGIPLCPRCGAPMMLRTARKGKRAGKQFWGCSTFPKCRGILNVG